MSVDNFKPAVWSRDVLYQFRNQRAFRALTNSNYEGEISEMGDSVRITTPDALVTGDVSGTISYQATSSTQQTLSIDQEKYVAFSVKDVDSVQSNADLLQAYTVQAGESLADDSDAYIASLYPDASESVNGGAIDKDAVYGLIVDAATALSDNKVPMTGRVGVVSPTLHGLLTKSPEFIAASDLGDEVRQTGAIGMIAGFTLYQAHQVVVDAGTEHNLFGHPAAITFASQLMDMEAIRLQDSFATGVRGQHLYGAEVIKPSALVDLTRDA